MWLCEFIYRCTSSASGPALMILMLIRTLMIDVMHIASELISIPKDLCFRFADPRNESTLAGDNQELKIKRAYKIRRLVIYSLFCIYLLASIGFTVGSLQVQHLLRSSVSEANHEQVGSVVPENGYIVRSTGLAGGCINFNDARVAEAEHDRGLSVANVDTSSRRDFGRFLAGLNWELFVPQDSTTDTSLGLLLPEYSRSLEECQSYDEDPVVGSLEPMNGATLLLAFMASLQASSCEFWNNEASFSIYEGYWKPPGGYQDTAKPGVERDYHGIVSSPRGARKSMDKECLWAIYGPFG